MTNDNPLAQITQLLSNMQVGNLQQQKAPAFADTPPIWRQQLVLGLEEQGDIRRFTQIRLWIKPPSQRFPRANAFMSLVNTKGSVFVRLNDIDELDALRTWLDNNIPQMRTVMDEQKPLEEQIKQANLAYDLIVNNQNGDRDDDIEA